MGGSEFSWRSTSTALGAGAGFMLGVSASVNPIFGMFLVLRSV